MIIVSFTAPATRIPASIASGIVREARNQPRAGHFPLPPAWMTLRAASGEAG